MYTYISVSLSKHFWLSIFSVFELGQILGGVHGFARNGIPILLIVVILTAHNTLRLLVHRLINLLIVRLHKVGEACVGGARIQNLLRTLLVDSDTSDAPVTPRPTHHLKVTLLLFEFVIEGLELLVLGGVTCVHRGRGMGVPIVPAKDT